MDDVCDNDGDEYAYAPFCHGSCWAKQPGLHAILGQCWVMKNTAFTIFTTNGIAITVQADTPLLASG